MYVDELLKQPVRLLMQVLQDFYTKKDRATSLETKGAQSNDENFDDLSIPNLLRNALYGSMLSSIYRAGLNYEQHRFGMDSLCKDLFTYVKQDRDFNTGFYLRPQSESEPLRNCAIYLASQVSGSCQGSLSKFLQMLLVGCGSVSIFDQFVNGLAQAESDEEKSEQLVSEYASYMSVGRNESASHWANRCCAVVENSPNNGQVGVYLGMVRLNRSPRKQNLNAETGLAKAAMAASLSSVVSSNLMDFTSVFNLIGAVADISACHREKTAIANSINKAISQPTCVAPPWSAAAARAAMQTPDYSEVEGAQQAPESDFSEVIDEVSEWLDIVDKVESDIRPSALLIGKVWTRLYFNLNNIADQHKNIIYRDSYSKKVVKQSNAAKIMRFNVLALLHAVLVEEDLYHSVGSESYLGDVLRQNPIASVDEFDRKIRTIDGALDESKKTWKDGYPLFFLLVSCPILHPFIFPAGGFNNYSPMSIKIEKRFRDLISTIVGKELISNDDWDYFIMRNGGAESPSSNKIIKHLYSAPIAGLKYGAPVPAKKEN